MTAILLKADTVVTLDSEDHIFQPGYMILQDDLIVEVGDQANLPQSTFDQTIHLNDRVLMPGLVNAHAGIFLLAVRFRNVSA
jgi:5-methylthioadenosine/S-adenosylhomocysteine deaminase